MSTNIETTPEMLKIIESFAFFDEWEERYSYLIDLGKSIEPLHDSEKIDMNKVHGCTSQVWLTHRIENNMLTFKGDSDAFIVRGLIRILLTIYSDKTPNEILKIDIQPFFDRIGFSTFLSPTRSNGFFSMVQKIQKIAHEHTQK